MTPSTEMPLYTVLTPQMVPGGYGTTPLAAAKEEVMPALRCVREKEPVAVHGGAPRQLSRAFGTHQPPMVRSAGGRRGCLQARDSVRHQCTCLAPRWFAFVLYLWAPLAGPSSAPPRSCDSGTRFASQEDSPRPTSGPGSDALRPSDPLNITRPSWAGANGAWPRLKLPYRSSGIRQEWLQPSAAHRWFPPPPVPAACTTPSP